MTDSEPSPASATAGSIKARVPGGVNAGFVGASRVEYDLDPEDEADAGVVQGVIDDASRAVSEALIEGSKYASIASEKLESAAITAGSSIYGALNPRAKLFASLASEAYELAIRSAKDEYRKAIKSVATMIHPEDLPNKASAKSAAVEAYDEALDAAEDEYSSFLNQISSAQQQYDDMLQEAKEIYQSAVDVASAAIYGTPQPAIESLVSVANEQYQQALRAAEKTYDIWYSFASQAVARKSIDTQLQCG